MSFFQQTLQTVLELDPIAGQLVLAPHHCSPQPLLSVGHKTQREFLGH
jgi:hypothetical protein